MTALSDRTADFAEEVLSRAAPNTRPNDSRRWRLGAPERHIRGLANRSGTG
jgi:hypothetical protein